MRVAFVTGASGFIGQNLVRELAARGGWRTIAIRRAQSDVRGLAELGVELRHGSIDDLASLQAALPRDTDAVFHVAASTQMWRLADDAQYRDNVVGTRNVVAACLAQGVKRLVHVSSQSAYAPREGRFDESAPQRGASSWIGYERTKLLAEGEVRAGIARGLDAVIVSPAHVLGPLDRKNWSRMARLIHQRKLPGVPGGAGSFADSREVARALVTAAELGRSGEIYLLGGPDGTFLEIVTELGRLLDRKVPTRPLPGAVLRAYARFQELVSYVTRREPEITPEGAAQVTASFFVDDAKACRELGYRHVPLADSLRDTVAWMKTEGLLQ